MGFFRGLGKFFGSTIFTTFFVFAILMVEMITFTGYDNFKAIASGLLEKQVLSAIDEKQFIDLQNSLLFQCSQTDKVNIPLGNITITLKCDDIKNSNKTELTNLITTSLIDSIYYKKFNCSFVDCIKSKDPQNLLVVATNEGNHFYKNSQVYMWIGAAVGLVLLLVSSETWAGRLKGVGFNLVFTGIPFLLLGYAQSLLVPAIPLELESSVKPVIDGLTSSLKNKFLIVLVIGVVLIVAGYGLGFYLSRKGSR